MLYFIAGVACVSSLGLSPTQKSPSLCDEPPPLFIDKPCTDFRSLLPPNLEGRARTDDMCMRNVKYCLNHHTAVLIHPRAVGNAILWPFPSTMWSLCAMRNPTKKTNAPIATRRPTVQMLDVSSLTKPNDELRVRTRVEWIRSNAVICEVSHKSLNG